MFFRPSGSLTINGSLNGRGGQFIELQIRITVRAADLFSIPDSCSTLLRIAVVPGTPMVPPTCPPATVVATRQDAQVGTILIRVRKRFKFRILEDPKVKNLGKNSKRKV